MPDTLSRLKRLLESKPHEFRPVVQTYNDIDVGQYVQDAELESRGTERGEQDIPASSETGLDAVEAEIVEFFGARQKDAHEELETRLSTLRQRLGDLDFLSRFSEIRDISLSGLADLKAEYQIGLDELHEARRDLAEAEAHRKNYRDKHKITRPTKIRSGLSNALKILILLLLVAGELIANGFFLSAGSDFGLVGGVIEALVFSVLNVGVAVLIAVFALPYLLHTSFFAKVWGMLWMIAFIPWTIGLNLGIAHYREVGSSGLEEFGAAVVERIQTDPLGLLEFESWILFALGVFFSVVALIDAFGIRDPFPQLQSIEDELRKRRATYSSMREAAIREISDVRAEYQEVITQIRAELGKLRREQIAIIAHKDRLISQFVAHETQLEASANAALTRYREANKKSRTKAAPKHFNRAYKVQRLAVSQAEKELWEMPELDDHITRAQSDLENVVKALSERYDEALKSYRELDVLVPGT